MNTRKSPNVAGFTLVELSIVLVIIGFIVAGTVGGRSLINNARTQSVVSEVERFRAAFNTFELNFNDLPGDMVDAIAQFPNQPTVVNGNGNGQISFTSPGLDNSGAAVDDTSESLSSWQHLSLSGILPGGFTGRSNGTVTFTLPGIGDFEGQGTKIGVSIPKSRIKNAGYVVNYFSDVGFNDQDGNFIVLGSVPPSSTDAVAAVPNAPAVTPRDAQAIDAKADDGFAGSGRIIGMDAAVPKETDTSTGISDCILHDKAGAPPTGGWIPGVHHVYNISKTSKECMVAFLID